MAKIVKSGEYKKQIDLKTKVDFEDRADLFDITEPSGVVSKDVFEAQGRARTILEEAKAEAAQIKKEAKEILEQVKEEMEKSKKEGDARGFQEGLARALEYLNKLHLLREKMFRDVEPQLVKLAYGIAEKVIGQQIRENDMTIVEVVRQALDAAGGYKVIIRLHPKDLVNIKAHENLLLSQVEATKTISFKEDEAIKQGGCIIESEVGTIDAQLDTQLNALKKALAL